MNKPVKNMINSGVEVKLVQPGKKKKWSLKSWQAFFIGLVLVEANALIKSLWIPSFPFVEVNTFLVWLLGFYLVKRVAQKSPKLGGGNDIIS